MDHPQKGRLIMAKHQRKYFLYDVTYTTEPTGATKTVRVLATSLRHARMKIEGMESTSPIEIFRTRTVRIEIDPDMIFKLLKLDTVKYGTDPAALYIWMMIRELSPYIIDNK